jgi:hypothetical protein
MAGVQLFGQVCAEAAPEKTSGAASEASSAPARAPYRSETFILSPFETFVVRPASRRRGQSPPEFS